MNSTPGPNRVRWLILPKVAVPVITRWLKGSTASRANQLLGHTGRPFWQDESYDHWVRNRHEVDGETACPTTLTSAVVGSGNAETPGAGPGGPAQTKVCPTYTSRTTRNPMFPVALSGVFAVRAAFRYRKQNDAWQR
jgi:hypothetical protein